MRVSSKQVSYAGTGTTSTLLLCGGRNPDKKFSLEAVAGTGSLSSIGKTSA